MSRYLCVSLLGFLFLEAAHADANVTEPFEIQQKMIKD